MGRFLHNLKHGAVALTMALLFLSEGAGSLLEAYSGDEANCGMACCRRMKSCCCRKGGRHETDPAKPQWQAGAACLEGCRVKAGPPQAPPAVVAAGTEAAAPGEGVEFVGARLEADGFQRQPVFQLFGRPPPSFS